MRLTVKQTEILKVVLAGEGLNAEGKFVPVDLDTLITRLSYQTTKASMQFSIRALIKHGLISKVGREKRRDRQRTLIVGTKLGHTIMLPKAVQNANPQPMPEIAFRPPAPKIVVPVEPEKTTFWDSLPHDIQEILKSEPQGEISLED